MPETRRTRKPNKGKPKYAKTTITVPFKLKARMNSAEKEVPFNWSAIASKAFEKKLAEDDGKGGDEMPEVVPLDGLAVIVAQIRLLKEIISNLEHAVKDLADWSE